MKINIQTKNSHSSSFFFKLHACNQNNVSTTLTVECTNNTYGQDCLYACGSCTQLEQCDVLNGSCSNGCDAGFMGDKCITGI